MSDRVGVQTTEVVQIQCISRSLQVYRKVVFTAVDIREV